MFWSFMQTSLSLPLLLYFSACGDVEVFESFHKKEDNDCVGEC